MLPWKERFAHPHLMREEHNICFTTVDRPDENEVAKAANEAGFPRLPFRGSQ